MLVSALGQRDADDAALLGLGVCSGLMDELRLFRTALGAAELASVWAAVAPRKPERKARQEGGDKETVRSVAVPWKFLEIIAGCGEKKNTSRGSYFPGIPSNCHQRHSQVGRKEYLKFRQGRGREKKKKPAQRTCPGDR